MYMCDWLYSTCACTRIVYSIVHVVFLVSLFDFVPFHV